MSKISPCLWFVSEAEEAANFYVSLLPNSRIEKIQRNTTDTPGGKAGSVLVVDFTLAGQRFLALNGGMKMEYTHALGCATRERRQSRSMWLAEGPLRRVVADRAEGVDDVYRRFRFRWRATRHAGDARDGQARYRRAEARV